MMRTPAQLSFQAMSAALPPADLREVAAAGHGEVFTRRWVADLVLDLAGYDPERDLAGLSAVEPACGAGAFLVPMVERLAVSCAAFGHDLRDAGGAIHAFDLLAPNVQASRLAVVEVLQTHAVPLPDARRLAQRWVAQADFLLQDAADHPADFVIGNPPYIRLENVPPRRRAAYRDVCTTMRGRSDVFVGFIERGLRELGDGGVLAFIVADRWMRNQYGADLRAMISQGFSVDTLVQMHDVDAFEDRVSAYPAIVVVRRGEQGRTVIADAASSFQRHGATALRDWVASGNGTRMASRGVEAARLPGWFEGASSWPAGSPEELAVLADLEARFPPLEDRRTGTRVGIGVATGADSVFLTDDPDLVEQDRLLPLVMAADTRGGTVAWSGKYLVSPWRDGTVVDLEEYPRLRRYLGANEQVVRQRYVAQRNPAHWYRTIDRVEPGLRQRSKLLLPDLKASIHPVLEDGRLYPHHNLYFVRSDTWDLEVLGGLLLSDVANLFVGAYCVKMRGGCYRFQAQYLRRIRLPHATSLHADDKRALVHAFRGRDVQAATDIACRLYGIGELPASCRTVTQKLTQKIA